ncbi:MAG: cytochrome c biogenesis protein CcdA, partial [Patescibacteria group bacterium]
MDQNTEPVYGTTSGEKPEAKEPRLKFIILAFGIFAVFVLGLIWLFGYSPSSPIGAGWFLFSFAAGLSMIVLPCTLPLAFVIVPLAMGKGYKKGLGVALTFGAGVAITLSLYGLLTAIVGQFAIASLGLQLETVKNWLYIVAGIFVIVFALTEIGLTKWHLPSYMGAAPAIIERRGDYLKALFLGLFLGNVGIGCPSPATYILLSRIAVSGDIFYGWLLFFVHAIGRITPLIFLAILGIIGINATKYLVRHKDALEKSMGWVLIFVGSFILVLGLFTHDGWVYSGQHVLFEILTG